MNVKRKSMSYRERLRALRGELARRGLDGFVIPHGDEHMSPYVGSYARRIAWLTGFTGSAATAAVLTNEAAIFVDGRYTQQLRQQVDGRHWSLQSSSQISVAAWLAKHASRGARVGYDPWFHAKSWLSAASTLASDKAVELVAVDMNPVDAVWRDRPGASLAKLRVHPERLAGLASRQKRQRIAAGLAAMNADTVVLTALDSIAWTFNLRGSDIEHTPVALAYALIHADGSGDLFVAPEKVSEEIIEHLGEDVRVQPRNALLRHLSEFKDRKVLLDLRRTVVALHAALEQAGARIIDGRDPTELPKAMKNAVELQGQKAAHLRDGIALCRFLHWFSAEAPKGRLTELCAATKLREFREEGGELRDLSFATISAAGPNGAIVHYRPTEETNLRIESGTLYLVDSGGQYVDGTTDVTRTVAVGTPSAQMRDRFTRVLKGHIALATAVFPLGTRGSQLDVLARQYLWSAGVDYAHGTGHGVGCYLCVHEGPQRIGNTSAASDVGDEPLAPGMILSNEPGYYKAGEYGIRIENLMVVVKREIPGAEHAMLGFETITLAPVDRTLIDVNLLTEAERAWVDAYHADVARTIEPQLDHAARAWLMEATQPLRS